jgi:CheY-like chemotaxis protein/two-component sensor histidine kinase
LRDHEDEIIGLVIVFQDITERKQAVEELRQWKNELEIRVHERTRVLVSSQDRLRSLASELSLTEERERRKLARDLHDYLVQLLVVGCMKLDRMKESLTPTPETEVAIQDLGNILQQALIYSRTTIAELSPPSFHESGLAMALQWLAEGMEKHGLGVEVHTGDQTFQLSEDRVILLFQSVRELLFNVLKHAGVKQATVHVSSESGGDVCITVEDRGKGLDVDAMQRTPEPGHLGLFAVRERMGAMGGRVALTSAPGEGTCVKLVLPSAVSSAVGAAMEGESESLTEKASSRRPVTVNSAVDNSGRNRQPSTRPRVRVLLVDDHAMFRSGMQKLLERYEELEIVGEAKDGAEAVVLATRLMPDVVVMDINMPKLNGIEATRQICRDLPAMKVIGLSMNSEKEIRAAMLEAGAIEYLEKNGSVKELYQAICALFPNQS